MIKPDITPIVEACCYLLQNYPEAQYIQEYLDQRINKESQEKFQFGYFPNTQNIQLLIDLVGQDILLKNEMIYPKRIEDSMSERKVNFSTFDHHPLTMPFKNPYGKIMGLVCRTFLTDQEMKEQKISKYKNTKFEKGRCVYGLYENRQEIINQDSVFVVEGQFDAIKAKQIGINNIVAIGNNTITAYQLSILCRYTNNIFLLLDNDPAGEKGRQRAKSKFGTIANIKNFYVPNPYKDVDEYITKEKIISQDQFFTIIKEIN